VRLIPTWLMLLLVGCNAVLGWNVWPHWISILSAGVAGWIIGAWSFPHVGAKRKTK
jgi:hypothetical protein